jgi:hypothetical protein
MREARRERLWESGGGERNREGSRRVERGRVESRGEGAGAPFRAGERRAVKISRRRAKKVTPAFAFAMGVERSGLLEETNGYAPRSKNTQPVAILQAREDTAPGSRASLRAPQRCASTAQVINWI